MRYLKSLLKNNDKNILQIYKQEFCTGKQEFSLFIFFQYQEDHLSNAVNTVTAFRIQMLLFNLFLEVVVEGEYKDICAEHEGKNTLKKVQPNYAIPSMQTNTSLMSFTARGQKEHIHTDSWSERREKTKPRETWMASRQCFLGREPTWNWVLCPVSCSNKAPRENYSIPGHFVLNYCWWFVWSYGSRWYHPGSPDWKIKTSPFATGLGFGSELGTGKYFRNPCVS